MRTSFVCAAIFGLFAAGCAGELSGTGEGDDVQPSEDCGNSTIDSGETCDDGNITSGDGCSASCQTEQQATPRIDVTVDKPTVATELRTTHEVTVTIAGMNGFAGAVDLAGSAVDGSGAPITGWTVTLDQAQVTLAENGNATAKATVTIPSQNNGLTGTVRIVATAGALSETGESQFTVANQVTYAFGVTNGQCVFPTDAGSIANPVLVKVGTMVRFQNTGNVNYVIHSNGQPSGVPHQGTAANQSPDDPITEPNTAYERTTTTGAQLNQTWQWYCHQPDTNLGNANPAIRVVP